MQIKDIAEMLTRKYGTNCPFTLAKELNIIVVYEKLGDIMGYYSNDFRFKFIHINQDIPSRVQRFVCAHELGHATCHSDVNTPFLKRNTLFSVSKIEREANTFAVELLLTDSLLLKYADCNFHNLAAKCGIPPELVCLKR